ncbi:hypothetical protein MYX07_02090 [Patescibacteria group bacterium AH-259-L07]|nr:hypothetical protein [Patescibacteria group bacterium AH-259-L07]
MGPELERITIIKQEITSGGWRFVVAVGTSADIIKYRVEVDKEYYEQLTHGKHTPEGLVKKSFEFLLAREPKESILGSFNLNVINTYFPEYNEVIKRQLT